ncbi:MAG: fluoride efflux transporter FluC [Acidobacteriota bacterium]
MARKLLLIAFAGAAGTLARFWLSGAVYRLLGTDFPWGTWAVNVLGCLLFGLVWVLSDERFAISGETRLIVLVGFMGAFTTFSTYVFESAQLATGGEWLRMSLNLLGQNVAGFAAFLLGVFLGRVL